MHKALFFGSFNPIHNGHMAIAQYVIDNAIADQVIFVVSPGSPFKDPQLLLDKKLRIELVNLAVNKIPHLFASDIEFQMPVPSYTVDTLRVLRSKWPDDKLSLLLGADQIKDFHRWKNHQEIIKFHKVLFYPRADATVNIPDNIPNIELLSAPLFPLSSTDIRHIIASGGDAADMLPSEVYCRIRKKKYYL